LDNKQVADRRHVVTVGKWRSRFVTDRLGGLHDEARSRPASVRAEQVEEVAVATLEQTPKNATHWTRSKTAERMKWPTRSSPR
jgi:transposase